MLVYLHVYLIHYVIISYWGKKFSKTLAPITNNDIDY